MGHSRYDSVGQQEHGLVFWVVDHGHYSSHDVRARKCFLTFKGLSQEGVSAPGKNTRDVAKKGSYKHLK